MRISTRLSFATQRLWLQHPDHDNSGVSAYVQAVANHSAAPPFNQYAGAGLTTFGLIPRRNRGGKDLAPAWAVSFQPTMLF